VSNAARLFQQELQAEQGRAPDLNDMFLNGLSLRQAVALEKAIKGNPEVPAAEWWTLMRGLAAPVRETQAH
jgi:hypothetical protein